jgi:hypothetical protein
MPDASLPHPTRRRRSRAEIAEILAAWRSRGSQTTQDFCRSRGLTRESLRRWALRSQDAAVAGRDFVQVALPRAGAARHRGLIVRVCGAEVPVEPGFDGALLRAVVAALAGGPC